MSNPLPPLGKYQPLAEIGSGGFAMVYRARDTSLERDVALKVLKPRYLGDPEFVERFFREARTVASLDHPAIVEIYDVDSIDGRAFIAMQLADDSLAGRLDKEGPLPWARTLELLRPICEALDYAHGVGLIHRDLKPANILLVRGARPMISDFGFARATSEPSITMSTGDGVLGTPGYIAPEIWDGQVAGPPADHYALACIAYEMLTGQALFQADTPARAVQAHVVEGPLFPSAWPLGVPPDVADVFAQALRREPERRFKSSMAFLRALQGLTAAAGSTPTETSTRVTPPHEQVTVVHEPTTDAHEPTTVAHEPTTVAHEQATVVHEPTTDVHEQATVVHEPTTDAHEPTSAVRPVQRSLVAQLGGPRGCTLAVTLVLLIAIGGLGGLGLLTISEGAADITSATDVSGAAVSPSEPTATAAQPTASPAPPPTNAPPEAPSLPTIQAAPTPVREWSAEQPEQGRVLFRGDGGELFAAGSADKDISPAFAGEAPSCIEGIIVAPDGSRLRHSRVELANGVEVRRADHDHLTGTYAMCGLEPGDWEVAIAEYLGIATSPAERAGHAVRFHTSGTPGEIFYISFQMIGPLPEPAMALLPPPVANPRPAESYDGRWEGTFSGMTPYGPADGRLAFQVSGGRVVYTESEGAPCAWADPDLRVTVVDGFSFAGLAVGTGVYYELAAAFSSPGEASGTLTADVGPDQPCLNDATWSAERVGL